MEVVKKGCEQDVTEHRDSINNTLQIWRRERQLPALPGHTYDTKGRRNSETLSISEEDAYRPISELHISPCFTQETGVHQNVTRKMWAPKLDHKEGERTALSEGNNQRKEGQEHQEIQRYGHTPICQRSNRTYTADCKTPWDRYIGYTSSNIRRILVHPKDKVEDSKKTDCVYQIPCKSCNHTYIGETGKTFGTRLE